VPETLSLPDHYAMGLFLPSITLPCTVGNTGLQKVHFFVSHRYPGKINL
jgi:hypothetical protein